MQHPRGKNAALPILCAGLMTTAQVLWLTDMEVTAMPDISLKTGKGKGCGVPPQPFCL